MLELQARCGARVGEVLKMRVRDVDERKVTIHDPKSGKEVEVVFMPEQVANRLKSYVQEKGLGDGDKLFDVCYSTARNTINRLGKRLGVKINPHDLRRHSATFARATV